MKILMVTMAMDIGGVETHILELSRKLQKRGLDITVASNGGAYEAELLASGIKHVKVPCHSKDPRAMRRSYKLLKKLIFEEKFDVVHAHARIPAFICSLLHKKYSFRFVTTAHWVFNPSFPYNILTQWGERSLAVSDDIKKYLQDNYDVPPQHIRVTINGIDLDKFSADTDYSDIKKEFSLTDSTRRIVYVSRMDTDRSYAAHKLIEITPRLAEEFPDLEVLIVGGGNDFEAVKQEAEAVNNALGRPAVILAGSRTDINKFAASADLFVGVSRAALEGMACEKPAIIAGNEGYIGIFDEDKLKVSIDTNFCCRGCEETTAEKLYHDVREVLAAEESERERLGKVSRETVRRHYSMDTMSDDAIKLYTSVVKRVPVTSVDSADPTGLEEELKYNPLSLKKKPSDVLISGYYGFGNMGDDSILETIVENLVAEAPSIKISALTNDPKKDRRHFSVRCINRMNLFSIARELRRVKVLISGGGSLFQDSTSSKSLKYYAAIVNLARLFGVKTYIYANGIGTIRVESNRRLTGKTVSRADRVTVRDMDSVNELISLGVPAEKIILSADPAFMAGALSLDEGEKLLKQQGLDDKKFFAVSLRRFEGVQKKSYDENALLANVVSATGKIAAKHGLVPVFIAMQPILDYSLSKTACNLVKEKFDVDALVVTPSGGRELLSLLGGGVNGAAFVCSMRLHTLIYSLRAAVPVIGLSADPKIDALVKPLESAVLLPANGFTEEDLASAMEKMIAEEDIFKARLKSECDRLETVAREDIKAVFDLMK